MRNHFKKCRHRSNGRYGGPYRWQVMRSHFTKRERRWHEPKDDATQTEWLALVFAVGCLVVLWVIGHWWSEGF